MSKSGGPCLTKYHVILHRSSESILKDETKRGDDEIVAVLTSRTRHSWGFIPQDEPGHFMDEYGQKLPDDGRHGFGLWFIEKLVVNSNVHLRVQYV